MKFWLLQKILPHSCAISPKWRYNDKLIDSSFFLAKKSRNCTTSEVIIFYPVFPQNQLVFRAYGAYHLKACLLPLSSAGRILIRVLEANLYLALFLWSPKLVQKKKSWKKICNIIQIYLSKNKGKGGYEYRYIINIIGSLIMYDKCTNFNS